MGFASVASHKVGTAQPQPVSFFHHKSKLMLVNDCIEQILK